MSAPWPQLDDRDWLAQRRTNVATEQEIADEIGAPVATVTMALISTGLLSISTSPQRRPPRGRPRYEPVVLDERLRDADWLRSRYLEDGWTVARIAAETGAHHIDVRGALIGAGVTERRPRRLSIRASG